MQFAILIYTDEHWNNLPADQKNRVHEACGQWHEALVKSGQSRAAYGLQPAERSRTVRVRHGSLTASDGPFVESKEVLGGLEIIDCAGEDQALAIARDFPGLHAGCTVEIRPLIPGGECRD